MRIPLLITDILPASQQNMSHNRPSSSFYPLLSIVQLLSWGYSGLDARRILVSDTRGGAYDLLVRSRSPY